MFIVPHQNETTAAECTSALVEGKNEAGLVMLRPENSRVVDAMGRAGVRKDPSNPDRYIYFSHKGLWYCADPNRIYTKALSPDAVKRWKGGKWIEVKPPDKLPEGVRTKVLERGKTILQALHLGRTLEGRPEIVVAAHNNTPTPPGDLGTFSLLWYKKPSGRNYQDVRTIDGARQISEDEPQRIDNLMVATDLRDYSSLARAKKFNVVLLKQVQTDDGSLSVFCAREGIRYVNVEAEYSQRARQAEMLDAVWAMLSRR